MQMLISLPNGRSPAMRNCAVSGASKRECADHLFANISFAYLVQHVSVVYQKRKSGRARLLNVYTADARDVALILNLFTDAMGSEEGKRKTCRRDLSALLLSICLLMRLSLGGQE
ncbi:hypothetical protein A0H81_09655, partial [Grifola frondosa]